MNDFLGYPQPLGNPQMELYVWLMWVKQCHFYHPWLGMETIPPIDGDDWAMVYGIVLLTSLPVLSVAHPATDRIRMSSGRSGCVPQHLRHHDHQSSIVHQYIRRDDPFSGRDFMVSSWLFNNCLIVIEWLFNGSQWWFTGEWNLMAIKPCKN